MPKRLEIVKMGKHEMPIGGNILKPGNSQDYKTGNWKTFAPKIDDSKCIHCIRCVLYCPEACIAVKDSRRGDVDMTMCKGCGICSVECPVKCIEMVEK